MNMGISSSSNMHVDIHTNTNIGIIHESIKYNLSIYNDMVTTSILLAMKLLLLILLLVRIFVSSMNRISNFCNVANISTICMNTKF